MKDPGKFGDSYNGHFPLTKEHSLRVVAEVAGMFKSPQVLSPPTAALMWPLAVLLLAAAQAVGAPSSGSRFTVEAAQTGAGDARTAAGGCYQWRGEPGQAIVGSGEGGRWSVIHGFWAGAGAAKSDSVFFHSFEECAP